MEPSFLAMSSPSGARRPSMTILRALGNKTFHVWHAYGRLVASPPGANRDLSVQSTSPICFLVAYLNLMKMADFNMS